MLASKLQLALSELGREFLLADAQNVKREYAPGVLSVHLSGFLAGALAARALQAAIASLQHTQRTRKASGRAR